MANSHTKNRGFRRFTSRVSWSCSQSEQVEMHAALQAPTQIRDSRILSLRTGCSEAAYKKYFEWCDQSTTEKRHEVKQTSKDGKAARSVHSGWILLYLTLTCPSICSYIFTLLLTSLSCLGVYMYHTSTHRYVFTHVRTSMHIPRENHSQRNTGNSGLKQNSLTASN